MMKFFKRSVITILACCTFSSFAHDQVENKQHTFGGQWSIGSVDFDSANNDDDGILQIYSYYNYALNKNLAFEIGLSVGADIEDWCNDDDLYDHNDDWHCDSNNHHSFFNMDADELEYSNVVIALKKRIPLSQKSSFYGKVGGQFYDYEILRRHHVVKDESDVGLFLEAGWQYRWNFGLGLNLGMQYMDMGELETRALTAGISYQF